MLHEVLLSLSLGEPPPFLKDGSSAKLHFHNELVSPAELSLLGTLAELASLHNQVREHATLISSSHVSSVCRAVSSSIISIHLARFTNKVLEVEESILKKDAAIVGSYEIVPLSAVVVQFDEWTRRMEWLLKVSEIMRQPPIEVDQFHQSNAADAGKQCTGAIIIDRLREEIYTGYPDIEEAARELIAVAENAWLRQLSNWVLYGRLPSFGAEDFFIKRISDDEEKAFDYTVDRKFLPKFASFSAAASILFIGRSLNHIRTKDTRILSNGSTLPMSPELALLPVHLKILSDLKSPISSSELLGAVSDIRLSLSKNTLQILLPLARILEIVSILRDFFLLGRGEFAVALMSEADDRIRSRWRRVGTSLRQQDPGTVRGVVVKEGEVVGVLARTWATLSSFQNEEDPVDEQFELARDLIYLSLSKTVNNPSNAWGKAKDDEDGSVTLPDVSFNDLLLSTRTTLSMRIRSPLDLFLTSSDMMVYEYLHSYLLSVRRAHFKLTDLWKHSSIRKDHPSPLGPPRSCTRAGAGILERKRARATRRLVFMRRIWATSNLAIFTLSEIGSYFQGDVVKGSWDSFRNWAQGSPVSQLPPNHATADDRGRGEEAHFRHSGTDGSGNQNFGDDETTRNLSYQPHDPETLSRAHKLYLKSLAVHLFLTDKPFLSFLRKLLQEVDLLVAFVDRIQSIWSSLDLEEDEGVVDAFSDFKQDEKEVLRQLPEIVQRIRGVILRVIQRLRELDGQANEPEFDSKRLLTEGDFVPYRPGGIDRLLMKLDFGNLLGGKKIDVDESEDYQPEDL